MHHDTLHDLHIGTRDTRRDARGAVRVFALFAASVLAAAALSACTKKEAPTEKTMTVEEAEYRSEERMWRMQREAALTAPDGWTSLVGLHWLSLKAHYVGSSERSGIRLMFGPPSLGMFETVGDKVYLLPEPGVALTLDDQPLKGRVELKDDSQGAPSVVGFDDGKGKLTVIARGGRHALRVKHADSPTRLKFANLDYWDPDQNWRIHAKFVPHPPGTTLQIGTIIGTVENMANPGALQFQRDGKSYTIEALDEGGEGLSLIIADRTSGHETYGAGRYLDVSRPDASGNVTIDFNRAYNPPCAFTSFATCPLPPNQNRLDLAITAGEKKYTGPH